VPEPSIVKVEIAVEKLRSYKSPGTDQIPAELLKADGEVLCPEKHKLMFYEQGDETSGSKKNARHF
jgi:hypothetical protein